MAARKVTDPDKQTEAAAEQVQETVDEQTEVGYFGDKVDPTPNEHYSVAGVTSGKPTPETDAKAAAAASKAVDSRARVVES